MMKIFISCVCFSVFSKICILGVMVIKWTKHILKSCSVKKKASVQGASDTVHEGKLPFIS